MSNDHILTLSCPDKPGIVHNVTGVLAKQGMNILDLQQYSDPGSERFFMRVHFGHAETTDALKEPFAELAKDLKMDYTIRPKAEKPKVLIMVSKIGHCLNDLLFRTQNKQLGIEIPIIVSNHPDYKALAEGYGIEFHHLPVNKDTKEQQETQILELIKKHDIELVVLARYMQVLSPKLCEVMSGKIINIHHSFLPSFKGAKPYRRCSFLAYSYWICMLTRHRSSVRPRCQDHRCYSALCDCRSGRRTHHRTESSARRSCHDARRAGLGRQQCRVSGSGGGCQVVE